MCWLTFNYVQFDWGLLKRFKSMRFKHFFEVGGGGGGGEEGEGGGVWTKEPTQCGGGGMGV